MPCSLEDTPGKLIVDSIHGDIHLTDQEWRVLDTLPFQRLRRIKQLQMGQVTYPNATHTRFTHSIGSLAVMSRLINRIKRNRHRKLTDDEQTNLRLAALLHDVGHYPYSHLMEGLDNVVLTEHVVHGAAGDSNSPPSRRAANPYPNHEELGTEILRSHEDLIHVIGSPRRAEEIGSFITRSIAADPQLSKLVHSSLDMDRLDYLKRDSLAAGVPYGMVDVNYLLNAVDISPKGLVGVSEKALHAAEQYLLARFFMHKTVYFHKTTFGIEEACRQLLRRMRDSGQYSIPRDGTEVVDLVRTSELAGFTDDFVDRLVHQGTAASDATVRALAQSIVSRRPPKLLKEVQVLQDKNRGSHHAGTFFLAKARNSLVELADTHGIPIGQFLLCNTKQVRLEPRGALIQPSEAPNVLGDREDELIKIFLKAETEPRSLVDIPHSIVHLCGGHFWQAFRLYVVYHGDDVTTKVDELRKAVRDWDSPTM
jgi:HD superfamily phosphohydrolase